MRRPVLVLALLAGVTAPATAKTGKKTTADKHSKPAPKKAAKRAARESTTVSASHHFKADNMPRGWQWPPSRTMEAVEKTCEQKLDALGVTWQAAPREGHVTDAIVVPDMTLGGVQFLGTYTKDRPQMMDCELALAWTSFAPQLHELGVTEVHFGSIYRWTKVRAFGKTKDALSRHALGLAMDVAYFVDGEGRQAWVGRDYKAGDELLLNVEKAVNDSGLFRLLLTPKNDPISHKDHFHFEANPDFTPLPTEDPLPDDPDRVDI